MRAFAGPARPARRALRTAAALAVVTSFVVGATPDQVSPAAAAATQSNGCLGVTGTFSTFGVPITGTAAPDPADVGGTVTLSGVSVAIGVDAALIGAGVNTGLVSAASSLAAIGAIDNTGADSDNAGINAVTAAPNSVKLKITGTNTAEGTQTAANTAQVNTTFYVVQDPVTLVTTVYTSVTNPPALNDGLMGAGATDPTRTGTPLVGSLNIAIDLGNTDWTPTGGTIDFSEALLAPSNLSTPTLADKQAAPLVLQPKINGFINVPFFCWPGTADAPGTSLVPAIGTDTITQVAVNTPDTTTTNPGDTTTTAAPTTTTTLPPTTTTVAPTTTTTTPPPQSRSATYATSCVNSLSPEGDPSNLPFTITATVPSVATAGQPFVVSQQKWSVTAPGSLLNVGILTGLISPGDILNGNATVSLFASNTAEGSITSPQIPVSVGPITVDPVTGNANDITSTFSAPDMSFTAAQGTTVITMGDASFEITIPPSLKVLFTCTPTTSPALATVAVTGDAVVIVATTTTKAPATTTTTATAVAAAAELPRTGPTAFTWLLLAVAFVLIDVGIGVTALCRRFGRTMRPEWLRR